MTAIVNIAGHLPALAHRQPDTLAVVCPAGRGRYTKLTYHQLDTACDELAHGLEAFGIKRGVKTVLMVPPGPEFFALTFALFKVGAVPVLVDPGMGVRHLGRCLGEAAPEAFIGIRKAHLARTLFGWARKTVRLTVSVGGWCPGCRSLAALRAQGAGPFQLAATQPEDPAAVLFTSGSTGPPKGAVYTHGIFAAQVEAVRQLYDIRPGEIDLPTFPLFALFAPALGMTAVIPAMDFTRPGSVDPPNIYGPIRDFRATTMFGSPALLARVADHAAAAAEEGRPVPRLETLKRVISAGAPVPARTIETFTRHLLPEGVQIYTPYGATEALPVCSIGSAEILGETAAKTAEGAGTCVGRPVPGLTLEVIRISDAPIAQWSDDLRVAEGEIGELAVKAPWVTPAYYQRPEATALAKIPDPVHGGFWHRMGDVGYRDGQGRVWFCGRKSHRVETAEGPLFTDPVEGIFNRHPAVRRTALVGVPGEQGRRPVLCVELCDPADDQGRIREELLALGAGHPVTQRIQTILFHPRFPVDIRHNAKIFREKLAEWARLAVFAHRQLGARLGR
jgi:acyl-CoA synthetase (AMP-forming)/AMP-acid ligase II